MPAASSSPARPKRERKKQVTYAERTEAEFNERLPTRPVRAKKKRPVDESPDGSDGGAKQRRRRRIRRRERGEQGAAAADGEWRAERTSALEPLLRASRAAAEWGWRSALPAGKPLCPLYYGCPEPDAYFCCSRHAMLWRAGKLSRSLMPASLAASAPDPAWVRPREKAEEQAVRAEASADGWIASSASSTGRRAAVGAAGASADGMARLGPLLRPSSPPLLSTSLLCHSLSATLL